MNDSVIIGFLFYLYRFYLYFHKMNSKFRGSKIKSEKVVKEVNKKIDCFFEDILPMIDYS